MKKYVVTLTEEERSVLEALGSKCKHRSQNILNALILLGCDVGEHQSSPSTNEEISRVLKISMRKIDRVKRQFIEEGLDVALNGRKGRRIYKKKADGDLIYFHSPRMTPSRGLHPIFSRGNLVRVKDKDSPFKERNARSFSLIKQLFSD